MWLLLRYPFVIRRQFALPLPFVTALEPGVLVGRGDLWDFWVTLRVSVPSYDFSVSPLRAARVVASLVHPKASEIGVFGICS